MDATKHTMDGNLRNMLEAKEVGLIEFSHKYWGLVPPNTHINGTIPIDAGCRSPDIEVTHSCMLPFINRVPATTEPGSQRHLQDQ